MNGDEPVPLGDSTGAGGAVPMSRRRMLTALGAAAMPTVAGCASSTESADDDSTTSSTMRSTTARIRTDSQSVDPRFGYIGTGDNPPPAEPDHAVDLLINEREAVPIPEFYSEPTGPAVKPGDTVRFNLASPHHNGNACHPAFGYTQRVPDGVAPYTSPILGVGGDWLYTFEAEGTHDTVCAPHELFGMVGSVVGPRGEPGG